MDQWRAGSPDSLLLPIFCVVIMVWAALFLDLWRRRNSSIAFRWGVDGVEDKELMRIAAHKVGGAVEPWMHVKANLDTPLPYPFSRPRQGVY